jgi:hypothetical protein
MRGDSQEGRIRRNEPAAGVFEVHWIVQSHWGLMVIEDKVPLPLPAVATAGKEQPNVLFPQK